MLRLPTHLVQKLNVGTAALDVKGRIGTNAADKINRHLFTLVTPLLAFMFTLQICTICANWYLHIFFQFLKFSSTLGVSYYVAILKVVHIYRQLYS